MVSEMINDLYAVGELEGWPCVYILFRQNERDPKNGRDTSTANIWYEQRELVSRVCDGRGAEALRSVLGEHRLWVYSFDEVCFSFTDGCVDPNDPEASEILREAKVFVLENRERHQTLFPIFAFTAAAGCVETARAFSYLAELGVVGSLHDFRRSASVAMLTLVLDEIIFLESVESRIRSASDRLISCLSGSSYP